MKSTPPVLMLGLMSLDSEVADSPRSPYYLFSSRRKAQEPQTNFWVSPPIHRPLVDQALPSFLRRSWFRGIRTSHFKATRPANGEGWVSLTLPGCPPRADELQLERPSTSSFLSSGPIPATLPLVRRGTGETEVTLLGGERCELAGCTPPLWPGVTLHSPLSL